MIPQQQRIPQPTPVFDESIMVVKRDDLFPGGAWQGLRTAEIDDCLQRIHTQHTFMPRSLMETDATYKQIIPYLVFTHAGRYFLMQRQAGASEQRLKSKMSLGIGGHLRQEDIQGADFFAWAQREFHEEVAYSGNLTIEFLGLLNDDANAVGQVHLGIVLLLRGDSSEIAVKSELKSGQLLSLNDCFMYYDQLESWSQLVFDALCTDGRVDQGKERFSLFVK